MNTTCAIITFWKSKSNCYILSHVEFGHIAHATTTFKEKAFSCFEIVAYNEFLWYGN